MAAHQDISASRKEVHAYRLKALLGGLMNELIGDSQIASGTQAIDARAVADVSAAWAPEYCQNLMLQYACIQ